MRSRRTKVIPRTAQGWTKPRPSGRTFRAFRGRMRFAGVSGGTVKFSEPPPPDTFPGTIDRTAPVSYTHTVGGISDWRIPDRVQEELWPSVDQFRRDGATMGADPSAGPDYTAPMTWRYNGKTWTAWQAGVDPIRGLLEAQSPSAQTTTLDGRPYVDAPKRTKLVGGLEKIGTVVIKPRFIAASTPHTPGGDSLFEMWNRVKGGKP